ncbi:hypothetical protein EXE43_11905 [Halorubrum sp. SS5]|nr:hypothetical protein EXE43_11905 [Halorubrum sp. SS5]
MRGQTAEVTARARQKNEWNAITEQVNFIPTLENKMFVSVFPREPLGVQSTGCGHARVQHTWLLPSDYWPGTRTTGGKIPVTIDTGRCLAEHEHSEISGLDPETVHTAAVSKSVQITVERGHIKLIGSAGSEWCVTFVGEHNRGRIGTRDAFIRCQ